MPLEPPQLRVPTTKMQWQHWMGPLSNVRKSDIILSCSPGEQEPLFCPQDCSLNAWDYLGDRTELQFPSSLYDFVYFNQILERHDHDNRQKLIQEGLRVLKPGGVLMSLSVACNDNEELYNFAKTQGFDTTQFEATRLMNRDIGMLRPSDCAFFKSLTIIQNRSRMIDYCKENGFPASLENCWTFKGQFPVNRLHVGLKWFKVL